MIALETGTIEQLIKAQAYGLGFDLVGITTLGPAESAAAFNEWLASGYAGEMGVQVGGWHAGTMLTNDYAFHHAVVS